MKLDEGKDLGILFTAVFPVPRTGFENHRVIGQKEISVALLSA